jgi:hypothetical protein
MERMLVWGEFKPFSTQQKKRLVNKKQMMINV